MDIISYISNNYEARDFGIRIQKCGAYCGPRLYRNEVGFKIFIKLSVLKLGLVLFHSS